MKEIPVTLAFNPNKTVGLMRVDETKLPQTNDYIFVIGGRHSNGNFELIEVAIVPDTTLETYASGVRDGMERAAKICETAGLHDSPADNIRRAAKNVK